ncbi:hypothetical protein LAZ67_2001143 [Cordylochernes scorpioides]|uniref:Reverse transcriptase domain-containing protein n=1 Tax=Cordylochernes scorpioides TaxID=51811 RepID=A0ABY6K101_9ARAC|nr:hypothetical protein LAZ67_2001143 [Cordylochernes scorpioides]
MEHRQKQLVTLIAIDIQGAFDNTWWPALFKNLDEDNLPVELIKILRSFLKNRKTIFKYNNMKVSKILTKGCPQGGPLSPLLWLIYLNDLLINLQSPNSEIICYADDVTIICWDNELTNLKKSIEFNLEKIDQWCNDNKLNINLDKTSILHLHNKDKISINFRDNIIVPVEEIKILGITIANHRRKNKLNFGPHLNIILNKTQRLKNLLFSICGKSWGLSIQKRLTLYKSIIRPTLTYGTEIWFEFISKKYMYKLNSMQYQILLWCTQTYKTTSYNCVHTLANIPLITDYMESRIIDYELNNLSTEDKQFYDLYIPGILKDFIISRINLLKKNTNQTFQSFFPYDIPKYFRPNYYNSQFITDHGNFRFFLKKIQAVQDSTCFCGLGEQTSIHLLLECPVFQEYRVNNGLIALGPSELISTTSAVIDCGRGEIHLKESVNDGLETDLPTHALEECFIPARSIKKITVINEDIRGGKDLMIEGSKDLILKKELVIPSSIINFHHGRGEIWVTNGTF